MQSRATDTDSFHQLDINVYRETTIAPVLEQIASCPNIMLLDAVTDDPLSLEILSQFFNSGITIMLMPGAKSTTEENIAMPTQSVEDAMDMTIPITLFPAPGKPEALTLQTDEIEVQIAAVAGNILYGNVGLIPSRGAVSARAFPDGRRPTIQGGEIIAATVVTDGDEEAALLGKAASLNAQLAASEYLNEIANPDEDWDEETISAENIMVEMLTRMDNANKNLRPDEPEAKTSACVSLYLKDYDGQIHFITAQVGKNKSILTLQSIDGTAKVSELVPSHSLIPDDVAHMLELTWKHPKVSRTTGMLNKITQVHMMETKDDHAAALQMTIDLTNTLVSHAESILPCISDPDGQACLRKILENQYNPEKIWSSLSAVSASVINSIFRTIGGPEELVTDGVIGRVARLPTGSSNVLSSSGAIQRRHKLNEVNRAILLSEDGLYNNNLAEAIVATSNIQDDRTVAVVKRRLPSQLLQQQ